jgi:hypothetical protein
MSTPQRIIPVYTSRGDLGAYLIYPHIYNRTGEWIGWVTQDRQVFSVHGDYVGYLSNEPRILRKSSDSFERPRRACPPAPERIKPPASVPLAPMMAELSYGTLDVLQDEPGLLPSVDFGDRREDLD